MLTTGTEQHRAKKRPISAEFDVLEAEAAAELSEVFGGEGDIKPRFRSKYYVAGVYPFRQISFECPGCSRWLSVSSWHSTRQGICPSCALTLSTPDIQADQPATLVSTAKEIPALPARRLPQARQSTPGEAPETSRSQHAPELTRFGTIEEEGDWGIRADESLVTLGVVKRFQAIKPWAGILSLILVAVLVAKAFMGFGSHEAAAGISSTEAESVSAPQHGSDLWVVLDALSTAQTPRELSSLVRKPTEMLPKMQAFYAANPDIELPHRFERARPGLRILKRGEKRLGRFEGRCDGRPVMFTFESTPHGWRLDWESLIGYSETHWGTFIDERSGGAQSFRVIAKISTDELIEYNRERYVCLHATDHFETRSAFVLVEKHSSPARKLEQFFKSQSKGNSPRTWISIIMKPAEDHEHLFTLEKMNGSWLAL